ncbi:MAG: hypothetical protein KR126chlam3_00925 [Chlamydiae bacterium]|nr:hypothetical protein [Chlamydiota bacterium]
MRKRIKKLLPFVILILLIVIVYMTNIYHYFNIEWIQKKELLLVDYARARPILAPLIYLGIYIVSVTLVIPDSTILTLIGAMIFPRPEGLILAVISETVGATIFFTIFQTVFGESLILREHILLRRLRKGFKKYSVSYLLFLRISHIVPFWFTNIAAAYFSVKYWTFVWTTLIGVIPLTFIIANAGHSLSRAFAENRVMTVSDIFTIQVKIALIVIGILALSPVVYKKWIVKKKWKR